MSLEANSSPVKPTDENGLANTLKLGEGVGGRAGDLAWSPRALSTAWEVRGGALYPGRLEAQQILVITTAVIGAPLVAQLVKNLPAMQETPV